MKYEIRIFKKKTIKAQYKMLQVKIRIWNKILNNSVKMSKQFTHEKKNNEKHTFVKTRFIKSNFQKQMYKWKYFCQNNITKMQ